MKTQFHSDNGAPCWRCSGTIYTYTVDTYVTYVGATCVSCRADNMFFPPKPFACETAADVSAAHRKSQEPVSAHAAA